MGSTTGSEVVVCLFDFLVVALEAREEVWLPLCKLSTLCVQLLGAVPARFPSCNLQQQPHPSAGERGSSSSSSDSELSVLLNLALDSQRVYK